MKMRYGAEFLLKKLEIENNMLIDAHVHIGSSEKFDRFFEFESFFKLMDKNNIDKIIAMPNVSSIVSSKRLNYEFLMKYLNLEEYQKNKVYPFILMDRRESSLILEQLDTYSNEIKGLKYHPSICQCTIDNPSLKIFLKRCEEYSIPILIHCGRNKISHIQYIVNVAKEFKNVNFIAAHMGGQASDLIEESIQILFREKLENVYLDISTSKLPYLIKHAINKLGSEKLIFASDEPYCDLRVTKYCFEITEMTDDDRNNISYRNIEKIIFKCNAFN